MYYTKSTLSVRQKNRKKKIINTYREECISEEEPMVRMCCVLMRENPFPLTIFTVDCTLVSHSVACRGFVASSLNHRDERMPSKHTTWKALQRPWMAGRSGSCWIVGMGNRLAQRSYPIHTALSQSNANVFWFGFNKTECWESNLPYRIDTRTSHIHLFIQFIMWIISI